MSRGTYRFRKFLVCLDEEPDAEPLAFTLQCAVCDQTGPTVEAEKEETEDAQRKAAEGAAIQASSWIETHYRANPEHFSYRLLSSVPYRIIPGDWL